MFFFQPGNPSCTPTNCICVAALNQCYFRDYQVVLDASKLHIPEGRHEVDYYFQIVITNNAKLVTSKKFKVYYFNDITIYLYMCVFKNFRNYYFV